MKQLVSNLTKIFQIDLDASINSGQVFLWKKINSKWYGIDGNNVLVLDDNSGLDMNEKKTFNFFRLDDNFEKISYELKKDQIVRQAIELNPNLRLLRQDPFQCYISFIASSNSNIPNIKLRLNNLCKKFGQKITIDNVDFFLFPEPNVLAKASIKDIKKCGLGYRSKSVKNASLSVINGEIDFEELKKTDYYNAKSELTKISGIGNKVADCIMLFSLEKLEAFPLDRWMLRVLQKYYTEKFQISTKTITEKTHKELHDLIVQYFGCNAGYAQQFLFKMERELYKKKWS
jgi:N-glycosylase/DNA lyase|tara:strand:+ start:1217 stop:2080 length:864 start_codon:yes stop_codon:yes gene_type:complete